MIVWGVEGLMVAGSTVKLPGGPLDLSFVIVHVVPHRSPYSSGRRTECVPSRELLSRPPCSL